MMDWASMLLTAALLYGGVRYLMLQMMFKSHKLVLFGCAFIFYALGSSAWVAELAGAGTQTFFVLETIFNWLQVAGVSCVLAGLAIENWEDRPPVARFPYLLCFTPFLLVITYVLVIHSEFMMRLLLMIYEAGGIMIALLMLGLLTAKNFDYIYALIGVILLLLAFVVYLFPGGIAETQPWIWKLIAFAGTITLIRGYKFATLKILKEQQYH